MNKETKPNNATNETDDSNQTDCAFIWDWESSPPRCYQCGELRASHLSKQEPDVGYRDQKEAGTTTWPTIQQQIEYWEQRDKDLDKIESACAWFDEKDRPLPF